MLSGLRVRGQAIRLQKGGGLSRPMIRLGVVNQHGEIAVDHCGSLLYEGGKNAAA